MEKRNSRCKQPNDQGEPIKTIEHVRYLSFHMSREIEEVCQTASTRLRTQRKQFFHTISETLRHSQEMLRDKGMQSGEI